MKKTLPILCLVATFFIACKKEKSPGSSPSNPPVIIVSTLAGNGAIGNSDGAGAAASFYWPFSLAVDAAGNVYVADTFNNLIRKISPGGVVSTLAGSGADGDANGLGIAASFFRPWGIAVDPAGNIFVSDHLNYLIREINPAGLVSTFAGNGTPNGPYTGTGTAASFYSPTGVALDDAGNLYVAGQGDSRIFKISPAAVVTVVAGGYRPGYVNGIGTSALFYIPVAVAADASGNLYVADSYNNVIRKISAAGVVSTLAGSGAQGNANGPGNVASFFDPVGVAVDAAGNVYVADSGNNLIRKISPGGMVSTFAGNGTPGWVDGIANPASFYDPYGIAVDAAGNVYVADLFNDVIRKIVVQ
jgi:sugar lactone lactonase YvrE